MKFKRLAGCEIKNVRPTFKTKMLIYQSNTAKNDEISPHILLGKFWGTESFPIISHRGNGNFRFP